MKSPFQKTALSIAIASLGLALGAAAQGTTSGTSSGGSSGASGGTASSGASAKSDRKADTSKSGLAHGEKKFVEQAAVDGMAEVELGRVAAQKAQSPEVKQFAQRMVDDHSKANEELKSIASSKGVTLPTQLDSKHRHHVEELQKKSADKFDREYMEMMTKEHKKDVSAFQKQAKDGKDAELKAFAAKTLPTLQEHNRMAQQTYDAVKGGGKSKGGSGTSKTGSSGTATGGSTIGQSSTGSTSGAGYSSGGSAGMASSSGGAPGTGTSPATGGTGRAGTGVGSSGGGVGASGSSMGSSGTSSSSGGVGNRTPASQETDAKNATTLSTPADNPQKNR